jgi:hypothetical protein
VLVALRCANLARVGNYLGVKSGALARLSPRAFEISHRFLSKGF